MGTRNTHHDDPDNKSVKYEPKTENIVQPVKEDSNTDSVNHREQSLEKVRKSPKRYIQKKILHARTMWRRLREMNNQ